MSMECDTRLAMMSLQDNGTRPVRRRTSRPRRITTGTLSGLAALALALFTRAA